MTKGKSDQRPKTLNTEFWKHKVQFIPPESELADFTKQNVEIISTSSKNVPVPQARFRNDSVCLTSLT